MHWPDTAHWSLHILSALLSNHAFSDGSLPPPCPIFGENVMREMEAQFIGRTLAQHAKGLEFDPQHHTNSNKNNNKTTWKVDGLT